MGEYQQSLIVKCFADTHPSRLINEQVTQQDTLRIKDVIFRKNSLLNGEIDSSVTPLSTLLGLGISEETPIIIVGSRFIDSLTENGSIQTSHQLNSLHTIQDASPVFQAVALL